MGEYKEIVQYQTPTGIAIGREMRRIIQHNPMDLLLFCHSARNAAKTKIVLWGGGAGVHNAKAE